MVESACSCGQCPFWKKVHIKDLPTTEKVLTIFGRPYEARSSHHAYDRYAKEARCSPQALVHKIEVHPTRGITREPLYIVFTEVDAKWVHHPHFHALVITVKMANNIVYRMLVVNDSATNILFLGAYQKIGLSQVDLNLTTFPLYGFTGDHVIPKGTINLAVTLGEHPRVPTMVTEFLVVNFPLAFNGVIGRQLLRNLKAVTLIHCLTLMFPIVIGIGQV